MKEPANFKNCEDETIFKENNKFQKNSRKSKLHKKNWKTSRFCWKYEKIQLFKKIQNFDNLENEPNFEEYIKITENFKTIQIFK